VASYTADPEVLKQHAARALFLCYPDDYKLSMKAVSTECLKHYTGEVVIHVGEMLGHTALENPWCVFSAVSLRYLYLLLTELPLFG